jgi:hypothetical protein
METFSTLLQVFQLVLFTLFMGNVGRFIIHLLINDDANS